MKRAVSVLVLAMLVGFGPACVDKAGQAALAEMKAQAELEARNIETLRTLLAEIDKGNADAIGKYYAPDAKYYFPSNTSTPMSRDEEVAMAKMMLKAIPDMKHRVTDIFAVKDRVVATFFVEGTHLGELEGIPATSKKLTISAICTFRFRDGLVVEEVEEANMLSLYQQLGMELKAKAPAK